MCIAVASSGSCDNDLTKAHSTSLGKEILYLIGVTEMPFRPRPVPTPGRGVQENIILSDDNKTCYLTCMGTSNVVVGDAVEDNVIVIIDMPGTYPQGGPRRSGSL